MENMILERMLVRAGIPKAYWTMQLSSIQDKELVSRMQNGLRDVPEMLSSNFGILITGRLCTGKSAYGCMLLREAITKGGIVHYVRVTELYTNWKNDAFCEGNNNKTLYRKYKEADLVVLDDLGAENMEPRGMALLEYALRLRYEGMKSTILVTNRTQKTLKALYPAPIWSMIKRVCRVQIVIATNQWEGTIDEY